MAAPAYYRTRAGRVFRVERVHHTLADGRARYVLRACAVVAGDLPPGGAGEQAEELSPALVRDKLRLGQVIPTAEQIFERLWERLRLELETLE